MKSLKDLKITSKVKSFNTLTNMHGNVKQNERTVVLSEKIVFNVSNNVSFKPTIKSLFNYLKSFVPKNNHLSVNPTKLKLFIVLVSELDILEIYVLI